MPEKKGQKTTFNNENNICAHLNAITKQSNQEPESEP